MIEELVASVESLTPLFELVGIVFDAFGVLVILVGVVLATVRFVRRSTGSLADDAQMSDPYQRYKVDIGLSLLLGLEILVAADIIKTVALEPNFVSVGVLGLLVVVRTFLGWTLTLEIEGRWPWQKSHAESPGE